MSGSGTKLAGRLTVAARERVQDLMACFAAFRVPGHDGDDPSQQHHHSTGGVREAAHDHEHQGSRTSVTITSRTLHAGVPSCPYGFFVPLHHKGGA